MDKLLHKGENAAVVGSRSQHQLAVAEGILHRLSHIAAGQIIYHDFGAALLLQQRGQLFHRLLGMAVYRGIGDHHALFLRAVRRPNVIQIQIIAQIFRQHRAVQRTNGADVQILCLAQQLLHLCAVLAHDADVVPACFASPVFLHIQRAKLAKGIGREQNLVLAVIGDHYLRPMHHRRQHKGQGASTQIQGVTLAHHHLAIGKVRAEELLHHGKGAGRCHDFGIGIGRSKGRDVGRMVGLHMLHHQIIGTFARQSRSKVLQPLRAEPGFYRVKDGDFLVQNDIRVIGHSVGHRILPFKQVDVVIVYADILDAVRNKHCFHSSVTLRDSKRIVHYSTIFNLSQDEILSFAPQFAGHLLEKHWISPQFFPLPSCKQTRQGL